MRIVRLLFCFSVCGGSLLAQESTPTPPPVAVSSATPAASPAIPEPVLLPESTPAEAKPSPSPVNAEAAEARDEAFKEVGEAPPSDANPPPPAQGAPPVGGEDVIPLPDGVAIPPEENQMPSEPSVADDEQLVLPGDIPATAATAMAVGPNLTGPSSRDVQVAYVKARTEVDKDPKVRSLKDQADAAKTDEAKRQALRAYYRLLFQKIRKLDPTLVKKSEVMEAAYIRRLEQNRIEPSIPLNPPPTPEPLP